MIRIAICDDETPALSMISEELKGECRRRGIEAEFDGFGSGTALLEKLEAGLRYDVLFADICMPGLNGIRLGTLFHEQLSGTVLIYVSSREDLVFETFQAKPFRFMRKKHFQEELPRVMSDLLMELSERKKKKLTFRTAVSSIRLSADEILYVESLRKKQLLHTKDSVYEVQYSFQGIMTTLKPYGFVQTHKSYLVNCRYIRAISYEELELDDHTTIPIGRTRLSEVKEAFRIYAVESLLRM